MFKKTAVIALISGFAVASFATAATPEKPAAPVAAGHKAKAHHCDENCKHDHCHMKHEKHDAEAKSEAPAKPAAPAAK